MSADSSRDDSLLLQPGDGEGLKRTLYFFFLNPADKWSQRKRFPGKLLLKIVLAVLVCVQLVVFSQERMPYFEYATHVDRVLHHKFLKDWDSENDPYAFPPGEKLYSLYEKSSFFEHIAHVLISYYALENESLGSFHYHDSSGTPFSSIPQVAFCVKYRRHLQRKCTNMEITEKELKDIENDTAKLEEILEANNVSLFERMNVFSTAEIEFNLESLHETDQSSSCHKVETSILFDNSKRNDMIGMDLSVKLSPVQCRIEIFGFVPVSELKADDWFNIVLDAFVVLCCLLSVVISVRSVVHGLQLMKSTETYFKNRLNQILTFQEKWQFFHLWYIFIILNDTIIIVGTCIKFTLSSTDFDNGLYTCTSLLLGFAIFVVSIDLLRYLTFLNVLISMTKIMTNVLQLMICAGIMYTAFLLAGWTIIGPYSPKFHTLSRSSKTLFSLLNGDDMFATFVTVESSSTVVLVFSTVFVYSFVMLFIYVLLSLTIAIFEDAWYKTVKDRSRYQREEHKTNLQKFIDSTGAAAVNDPVGVDQ